MINAIRLSERNAAIAAMLSDGQSLKNFYRFAAQNPHIDLHDACQIVIARPNATVCFAFEEWNAMERRVTRGRRGIPYYDRDGNKRFVFDANDTHGELRYQRMILPMKRLLAGLDELNGTEYATDERSDYRKIHNGVAEYLKSEELLTEDTERNRLLIEGVTYSLYCKTGFPKEIGIELSGLPYTLKENAELFKTVNGLAEELVQEANEEYVRKQSEVRVIDDTDEETVTDEPKLPMPENAEGTAAAAPAETPETAWVSPYYREYLNAQSEYPQAVVLMRVGDFYEVIGENAKTVAEELDLTLTGREVDLPERVPMCGFPYHVTDEYIERLSERHSVVVVEKGQDPKYILSRAEIKADEPTVSDADAIAEPDNADETPEEPDLSDFEDVFDADDYAEIADEYNADEDYDADDADEDLEKIQPQKEKGKEKPISRRRREKKPQPTLFDYMDSQEPTREEQLKEWGLRHGDRLRIYDKYKTDPTVKGFAEYLKDSFGWSGSYNGEGNFQTDAKGAAFAWKDRAHPENDVAVALNWTQFATGVADLIDDDKYLNEEEKQEYARVLRYRAERNAAQTDGERCKVIARQIVEYGTAHTYDEHYTGYPHFLEEYAKYLHEHRAEINELLLGYEEVSAAGVPQFPSERDVDVSFKPEYCPRYQERLERRRQRTERLRAYADGFIKDCATSYTESDLDGETVVWRVPREKFEEREFLFLKDNRDELVECLESVSGVERADFSMQRIEIVLRREYLQALVKGEVLTPEEEYKIGAIAARIIEDGTVNTTEGNWITSYDTFGADEKFVRANAERIADELCKHKEVSDVDVTDEYIDTNFYWGYCPNYEQKEEEEEIEVSSPAYNRFTQLTPEDKAYIERYAEVWQRAPVSSPWGTVQNRSTIADGIYIVSTAGHGGLMVRKDLAPHILSQEALAEGFEEYGYYCYEEDAAKDIPLRELYDKGILKQTSEYFTRSYIRSDNPEAKDGYIQFGDLSEEERTKFFAEWNSDLNKALLRWYPEYWQAHEQRETSTKQTERQNTDLNETGTDAEELGGAKQRYRNNLEAIRLTNRLYDEDRDPTPDEKKVLARYVGWGGLAQAFDVKKPQWQKEYEELRQALTTEQYEQAKGSVLNAHYTPKEVIDGMYRALARFGVRGNNRILEPAMGTGNFYGYMPREIASGARLYGVELDGVTGGIAAKLYPQVKVQVKGFEDTTFPNNHFDLVISNVPFGGYGVADSEYNRYKFLIHDYFIAKSLDKVRPRGIVAVITSKGTMDKLNPSVRKYLADRAELLGAMRLPNTAFKKTANTEAVTDILFFQKREEPFNADTQNTEWLSTGKTEEGYEINNYFIRHPEMILGTLSKEHGLYGAIDTTVHPDNRDLSAALNDAIARLPENVYTNPDKPYEEDGITGADYNVRPLCYKAENGRLYVRVGERMEEQDVPKFPQDAYQRIKGMIELRTQLRHILEIQTDGCPDEQLANEQRKLNANYDAFVRKYGILNSQTNARLFREDGDSALLFACENVSEDKKTATKAEIFTKRTIRPYTAVRSTDDCYEALQYSMNERGSVDISYIEELTKKDYDTVLSELADAVFRNPETVNAADKYSGFESAEEYLSGKVVQKLQQARKYAAMQPDAGYDRNVRALESVQPVPLTAADISVRLGASWVDKKYYEQFICELLHIPKIYHDGLELFYNVHDSSWRVDKANYVRNTAGMQATDVYGTNRANAFRLFEDCMNLRATNIYDTVDEDGREKRVLNQAETIAAREKQNKIKEAFRDWVFKDAKRREELEQAYNRLFNRIRLPVYDGSYLKFPEMNPTIELRPHQKNAVHRIITGGNTLLHHVVGSGKTYTMCAAIMKLRQYGLATKPMIAVPNHLVEQWAGEFRTLYPNAKLLIANKEDLSKENRQRFVSKVALGDWDAVIIAQSSFAKIPISPERQIAKIQEEIGKIDDTIAKLYEESGFPGGAVKNLERIKKNKTTQLKRLLDDNKKDNLLTFESLGVDYLFVDEAHFYKNKFLYTKMNNVAGISTAASQRAADLELKAEYINELHGGDKGVVFATGTPISNSMTEMYTMQSYLQKRTLEELGIHFFDAWAADFGETVTALELAPSGQGYKPRTRFAKFTNLPELQTLYRSFADVQTADMVKLDVPQAERNVVTLKPSETVIEAAEEIAERAERISLGGVDPREDNMLKVTSDGKKLALDVRCFDPIAGDEENSKLNACAQRIYEIWERTSEKKSAQIVFCDMSTPKQAYAEYEYGKDFDVYNDLKHKLTERGIPEQEIAYIHEANTDQQKQDLFKKVNAGQVRVLIGSTEKCGAGTNAQKRLIALHHLDTPYRPSDMEQREGRIIRQGNTNDKVQIYTYVTERTFDSYSYQILENKQRFISQICRGDMTAREMDDIDETTLTYAEIKAITAANPRIKRKMEVDGEVSKLRVLEGQYRKNLYALEDKVNKTLPEQIRKQELFITRLKDDIARIREQFNPETFCINVNGVTYTDRKEGGRALTDALYASKPDTVVAEYGGMKISMNPLVMLTTERTVTLAGSGQYSMEIGQSASGNLTRLDNFLTEFEKRESRAAERLSQLERDLETAKSQLGIPFEHKEKLTELLQEQSELNAELDLKRREEVVIADDEENESEAQYMELPTRKAEQPTVKRKSRKSLNKYSMTAYDKQKAKTPEAYIFVKNGSQYELFGEQAERYAKEHGLPVITDTLDGNQTLVLSLDIERLDKAVRELAEKGHTVKIIETLEEKKEESIIDEEDKIAAMETPIHPDYLTDTESMHRYGYTWDGMLPMKKRTAKRLWVMGLQIYKLNEDDTETEVMDFEQFTDGALYGIEKPVWNNYLSHKATDAYIAARMYAAEAAGRVINEQLDYVDAKYADPMSDVNYEERAALTQYMRGKEMPGAEQMKPYITSLLTEYADIISLMPLERYGWEYSDIPRALAAQLGQAELKEYAEEQTRLVFDADKVLQEILSKKSAEEIAALNLPGKDNRLTLVAVQPNVAVRESAHMTRIEEGYILLYDHTSKKWYVANDTSIAIAIIDPVSVGGSTMVKEVLARNGLDKGNPLVEFPTSEEARAYFNAKSDELQEKQRASDPQGEVRQVKEMSKEEEQNLLQTEQAGLDYKQDVIDRIEQEYGAFRQEQTSGASDAVFKNHVEIYDKTELYLIVSNGFLPDECYRALYEEKGDLLTTLYADARKRGVNLGEPDELTDYINAYCEENHKELLDEVRAQTLKKTVTYFGKDETGTAYYYFSEKLSQQTLSFIQERADRYMIASPVCYLSDRYRRENGIEYLQTGWDISEEKLTDPAQAIENMRTAYEKTQALTYVYRNVQCKDDIESAINENYDGYHLNKDFEDELIEKYGTERLCFVLANTVQQKSYDGRFSPETKTWAAKTQIEQAEDLRNYYVVQTHPAVLDGFIQRIIRKEKEEEKMAKSKYAEQTPQGYRVVNTAQDKDGRNIAVLERGKDFAVAVGYDTADGTWAQGYYDFETQDDAEGYRREHYGITAEEKPKWLTAKVSQRALIKEYEKHSFMRMPNTSKYAGYTYNMFNNRIKESRQLVDLQSDGRELCYELVLRADETVLLKNRDGEEVELTAQEFKTAVGGSSDKEYEYRRDENKAWVTISVPREAMRGMYEHSAMFVLPNTVEKESHSYFIPNNFAEEDTESEEGRIVLTLPEDYEVRAQDRSGKSILTFTAQEFKEKCDKTTSEQYVFERSESAAAAPDAADGETSGWRYVSVDKGAKIAGYENRTLLKMPRGEYEGYVYYLPNKLLKENEEKGTIRVSIPDDMTVVVMKRDENKEYNLTAEEMVAAIKDKTAEDYTTYRKPSEETKRKFTETEQRLRRNVPKEMLSRPNWVAVRTSENKEKDKLNKYLISPVTGKFAESDNPETWTTFDAACDYARENGCIALAYALDGKDNIACIDLDHCFEKNGDMTGLASEAFRKSDGTYAEKSVSGNGLHIFGKTQGMSLRAFSRDGDLEFYQRSHFITMTGDDCGSTELKSLDTPAMKGLLERKCARREEWKGVGLGIEGLSTMSDREVVEKASSAKHGETFKALYDGQDLQNNHSNSDMSLMNRLAFWCNGDKEQMLRIFSTSGLYRPNKSADYYEITAIKAIRDTSNRFQPQTQSSPKPAATVKQSGAGNSK